MSQFYLGSYNYSLKEVECSVMLHGSLTLYSLVVSDISDTSLIVTVVV